MNTRAQSRSEQQRILESARKLGDLDQLYWYVSGTLSGKRIAATDPQGRLPVLPVGQDPEASVQWAHLLYEVTRQVSNIPGLATELTSVDLLESHFPGQWYIWGEAPASDTVCARCGGVNGCVCAHDPGVCRYAVAHKPGRARHIVVLGRALCGRRVGAYAVSWANARRRRAWVNQEGEFCKPCFEKWFFGYR